MGTKGSICHFSRALPARLWHCSQILVLIGGAEMTIILSDNNSRILTAP